jgi:hypothetical protein
LFFFSLKWSLKLLFFLFRGFFINKSNRTSFDPRPASTPHFSHSLFNTLSSYSASVAAAWTGLCNYSDHHHQFVNGPFTQLENQLKNFNGDVATLPANTWLIPQENRVQASYDLFRAQEQLSELFGVEELGAPREWNDEIQSIRSLPATELGEKIVKARLEYRVSQLLVVRIIFLILSSPLCRSLLTSLIPVRKSPWVSLKD